MNNIISWLPTGRSCDCHSDAVNCLDPDDWFRNQVPLWRFTNSECRGEFERYSRKVHPAVFHRALARRIIETFSHKGHTVLDVFSGVGTTLVAALELERNAVGIELNENYVRLSKRRLAYMRSNKNLRSKQIYGDARSARRNIPKNSIDLIVTSPPYWDMLKQPQSLRNKRNGRHLKWNYSANKNDLSNARSLNGFLNDMNNIISGAYSILKPGGRLVLITGDYRRRGYFIPLHRLYIELFEKIGLELKNIIFWDRTDEYEVGLYSYPHRFIVANGMIEYILDFQKSFTHLSRV